MIEGIFLIDGPLRLCKVSFCHARGPACQDQHQAFTFTLQSEGPTATLQVFIGDAITLEGFEFILPLLSEASNHPEAFLEFFISAEASFGRSRIQIEVPYILLYKERLCISYENTAMNLWPSRCSFLQYL